MEHCCRILAVGGGGGSRTRLNAGGGGAGGFNIVHLNPYWIQSSSYSITIGAGGVINLLQIPIIW